MFGKGADPDLGATKDQDNFNNFSNFKASLEMGDTESAKHWASNWLGEAGQDKSEGKKAGK